MKLRGGSLVALGAIVSACAVHVGDASPPPSPNVASSPAPAPAPAPAPPPAPQPAAAQPVAAAPAAIHPSAFGGTHAAVAPTPAQPATGGGHTALPAANARPVDTTASAAPAIATKQVQHINPGMFSKADPVNVAFMQQARARQPKLCGPVEVSPGNWVRIDCHMYQPITSARPHWSAKKTRVFSAPTGRQTGMAPNPNRARPRFSSAHRATGALRTGAGVVSPSDSGGSDFPDVVDHRTTNVEGPIKNQGYVGSCTAFSLSSTVDNAIRRAGKSDVVSPAHIWAHYGVPSMSLAGDANLNKPITSFESWPYSGKEACQFSTDPNDDCGDSYHVRPNSAKSDSALQAKLAKAEGEGIQKIISVEKLVTSPLNLDEFKSVLASGTDLWFAMYVGSTWMGRSIKDGVIPEWDSPEGGHAITMSGYRKMPDGTHQFLVHNSWGESWADHGYAWITEASVKKWLKYAYKVKLDEGGAKPSEITDDDCAEDELVDSVTNNCGKMCADESRPASGKCAAASGATKK